jgi:drug/metabolite transporter (DMT)-like permease
MGKAECDAIATRALGIDYPCRTELRDAWPMSMQASPVGKGAVPRGSVIAGIGLAASAYFLFSLQDASIKWLAAGFSAPQILFMRSVAIVPFCLAIGGPNLLVRAATSPIRLQLVWRSLVLLAAWACYYSAARYLQLAEMTTIYFASPLLVAALAMPILKERVPPSRWLGIAIGFTGVAIACRPFALLRADLAHIGAVALVLSAAALWAYTTILIRQVVHAASTPVVMLVSNLTQLVVCGASLPLLWQAPSAAQFGLMVLVGCFGGAGQFLQTEAIRRAPATVVAPLSFSSLVWSFLLSVLLWGDIPDVAVFVGAALILASGLLVAGAEWRKIRRARAGGAGLLAEAE